MNLDAETRSRLAAEYALGTLRGAARRRFETLLRDDAELRGEVGQWQALFLHLYDDLPEQQPSSETWQRIVARTGGLEVTLPDGPPGWWQSLILWRWTSAALAAALVAVLVVPGIISIDPPPAQPSTEADPMNARTLVLVLSDEDARAGWVMTAGSAGLSARPVAELAAQSDRSYQLWLIPGDQTPRSVGLIDPAGSSLFDLPRELERLLEPGTTLAVSLEPLGGSPTGQPTGPVLFTGQVMEL